MRCSVNSAVAAQSSPYTAGVRMLPYNIESPRRTVDALPRFRGIVVVR